MTKRTQSETAMTSYARDIRPLFTDLDYDHMLRRHLDLRSYDQVKARAQVIYNMLIGEAMPPPPPEGDGPWPQERTALFKRWRDEGCPP